ncbi:hypothetical protein AVEN_121685-1 [Araneus ventricosus]|uniref:Uncharacterized protein n=1 Tax=Araneus ventricosus TaxID=182803 RepID=A0A4Y2MER9_ARAVE|nr:hypothetical protein AVEN_121685-1 [Araneus ventricosus]
MSKCFFRLWKLNFAILHSNDRKCRSGERKIPHLKFYRVTGHFRKKLMRRRCPRYNSRCAYEFANEQDRGLKIDFVMKTQNSFVVTNPAGSDRIAIPSWCANTSKSNTFCNVGGKVYAPAV